MSSDNRWPVVSRERPCAKCGKDHGCLLAEDGRAGYCWHPHVWSGEVDSNGGTLWYTAPDLDNPSPSKPARTRQTPRPTEDLKTPKVYATLDGAMRAARRCVHHDATVYGPPWIYRDADNRDLMAVGRFDLPDGTKEFRPLRVVAAADGTPLGWSIGNPPAPLPLYGLDALPKTGRVYIVEGEKCVDAMRSIGLAAVTSSHGAASAARTDWAPLSGYNIVILPDRDEAGERYAVEVTRLLRELLPPAMVGIIRLDEPRGERTPDGFDVADWIAARDSDEPETLATAIGAMADSASEMPFMTGVTGSVSEAVEGSPIIVNLATVERRPVRWLWPGRYALGKMTMLVGAPGGGKSFATIDAAARVTTGTLWPDGEPCMLGGVVIANAEDDAADTIGPRFDACGGDSSQVNLLNLVRGRDKSGKPADRMLTLNDLSAIEAAVAATPDCRLLIVDPVGSFLGGKMDGHRDNEVRGVLAPLAMMAERRGVAVLIVMHTRKSAGGGADERAMGSRAFVGIARVVLHLLPDPQDAERRLLLPGKVNVARKAAGLAFRIVGDGESAAPVWERDPIAMTADEAYRASDDAAGASEESDDDEDTSALGEAVRWLARLLLKGPCLAGDRKKSESGTARCEATNAGISIRTLDRAKTVLKVISNNSPSGWMWRLPRDGQNQWILPDEVRQAIQIEADEPDNTALAHLAHIENGPELPEDSASTENVVSQVCQAGDLGTHNAA
jgi:putative DNA primase/helicase